jgi:hypothetical protein
VFVPAVPGFEAAVRRYVLHVLGISYQRVTKRVLGDALQLQGGELDNLVSGVKPGGRHMQGAFSESTRTSLGMLTAVWGFTRACSSCGARNCSSRSGEGQEE